MLHAFSHAHLPVIDGATYLLSAAMLWMINGNFNASDPERKAAESICDQFRGMTIDGARYLSSSFFGALILLKASAGLSYGACDVLNVVISEHDGDLEDSSKKLGILFSMVGVGCLIGPILTEPIVDLNRPATAQLVCLIAFVVSTVGHIGWSIKGLSFWYMSAFALIRSAGSSINWINSTLLLQKLSTPDMLGRILAVDYAMALLAEAFSAYICGVLIDQVGLSAPDGVSFVLTIVSTATTIMWAWYHFSGRGAVRFLEEGAKEDHTLTRVPNTIAGESTPILKFTA